MTSGTSWPRAGGLLLVGCLVMSTLAWQVHFTRRRLPWQRGPRPLLGLWEQQNLDAWLDAEDIPEGLPFLRDPDGHYDLDLNRYFQRAQVLAGPVNSQRAIAYDLCNWLSLPRSSASSSRCAVGCLSSADQANAGASDFASLRG